MASARRKICLYGTNSASSICASVLSTPDTPGKYLMQFSAPPLDNPAIKSPAKCVTDSGTSPNAGAAYPKSTTGASTQSSPMLRAMRASRLPLR